MSNYIHSTVVVAVLTGIRRQCLSDQVCHFFPKFGKKYRYENERGRNECCVCHLSPTCYLHAQVYDFMIYTQTDVQKNISTCLF